MSFYSHFLPYTPHSFARLGINGIWFCNPGSISSFLQRCFFPGCFWGAKNRKGKKEIYLQNVLNVSENFGPDSDCVYSLFLPSGQSRESDSLDFIYVQPESAEIFVSNLLNLSRANLNKSAALNMQCLYY